MLSPAPVKIADKIVDYSAIAKKHGVELSASKPVVATHDVRVEIANMQSEMVNLVRVVFGYYTPSCRLVDVQVETNDPRVNIEDVRNRCSLLIFGRDAPEGDVELRIEDASTTPLIEVSSTQFTKVGEYAVPAVICQMASGHRMVIQARMQSSAPAYSYQIANRTMCLFNRRDVRVHDKDGVEFEELDCIEEEYNTGALRIIYEENASAKELWSEMKARIKEFYQHIAKGVADDDEGIYMATADAGIITLEGDIYGAYANALIPYLLEANKEIMVTDVSIPPSSFSLRIIHASDPVLKKVFAAAVKKLLEHVDII